MKANSAGATFTGVINTNSQVNLTSTNKLKYASGSTGQVLTSDATGLLSLATPSSALSYVEANIPADDATLSGQTSGSTNAYANMSLTAGTWLISGRPGIYCGSTAATFTVARCNIGTTSTGGELAITLVNKPHTLPFNGYLDSPITTTIAVLGSTTTVYMSFSNTYTGGGTWHYVSSAGGYFHAIKIA